MRAPEPRVSEPGQMAPGKWWRVVGPEGVWCETSVEAEARAAMRPGDRLYRLWTVEITEWRYAD